MSKRQAIPAGLRRVAAVVAVCLLAGASSGADTGGREVASAVRVKALFLRNFAKLVHWPDEAFEDERAPLVIGVLGRDPFGPALDRAVSGRTANGRPLEVRRLPSTSGGLPSRDDVTRCHLLYVSDSEQDRWEAIRPIVEGAPVMTVSDIEHFAEAGGVAEIVLVGSNFKFKVNRCAAREQGIRPSARLLQLAILVEDCADRSQRGTRGVERVVVASQ